MYNNGHKFFITGSNASMLSNELGTRLTGRNVMVNLYPFSFMEYIDFLDVSLGIEDLYSTEKRVQLKKMFDVYLRKGGMPEYVAYDNKDALKNVYDDILYRDIIARYDIKDVKALRELAMYFLSNVGTEYSYNKLKKMLMLGSENTVKTYVEYLENSFLVSTITKFSYSLKKQSAAQKKIYCIDNGFVDALAFQFSENKGQFLENLVFVEMKRRYEEVFYYKTENSYEVDFLVREGNQCKGIFQVTQNLEHAATYKREVRALQKAMEELKIDKATILTEHEYDKNEIQVEQGVIEVLPVCKWILEGKI